MAHKYTNFYTAFYYFSRAYADAKKYKEWAKTNTDGAYIGCSDPVDKLHFGYLVYAVDCLCTVFNYLADLTETAYDQSHLYESIYWAAQSGAGDPYVLDMEKILNAMWDSDKLRSFHFINYIDAMRASIWNTEIFEIHLEEWYIHFSE